MNKRNIITRFTLLEFFFYTFMGAFTPYMIAMGISRGYSQTSVSIAVSFQMICVLAGNVFWGRIADRFRTNRITFIVALLLCGVFQILLYNSWTYLTFFLMYGIFGTCSGAVGVLLDTWFLKHISYDISIFRKVRSAGAAGYAVSTLLSGKLVDSFGYGYAAGMSTLMILITIALCYGVRDAVSADAPKTERIQARSSGNRKMPGFLSQPMYLIWIVLLLLSGLATTPVGNMKIVILNGVGAGAGALGVDGFIGCCAQFVMFFLVSKLEKYSPIQRMMMVSACVMTGIILYVNASSVISVYIGSMLFYGIFSIINPCTREIVRDYVSAEDQTTATGIADACSNNVSTMIAMLYSGYISENFGVHTLLYFCLMIAAASAILCVMMMKAGRRSTEVRNCSELI